jgi:phosphorylcholine metabolism protein LicD
MKQNTGIRILKTLLDINRDWFILYGTLLGCIRDRRFIPWDHDIDIGIEYTKWDSSIKKGLQQNFVIAKESRLRGHALKYVGSHKENTITKYRLRDKYTDLHFCFEVYHEGVNKWKDYLFFQPPKRMRQYIYKMPKELLTPQIITFFYNLPIRIPKNYMKLIEYMYGNDWKTPIEKYYGCDFYKENSKKYRIYIPPTGDYT